MVVETTVVNLLPDFGGILVDDVVGFSASAELVMPLKH
jgi:hypothetical protein